MLITMSRHQQNNHQKSYHQNHLNERRVCKGYHNWIWAGQALTIATTTRRNDELPVTVSVHKDQRKNGRHLSPVREKPRWLNPPPERTPSSGSKERATTLQLKSFPHGLTLKHTFHTTGEKHPQCTQKDWRSNQGKTLSQEWLHTTFLWG